MKTYKAVWLESQHRWQINAQKDGKRRTFTCAKKGREGKAIVNEKAYLWLHEGIADNKIKVDALVKKWLKEVEQVSARGKYLAAKSIMENHIIPMIGNKKVHAMTQQDFQDAINKAYSRKLSRAFLVNIKAYSNLLLKYARKSSLTTLTLIDVEIPKGAKNAEKVILQPNDIKKMFEPSDCRLIHAFRFHVLLGLRPGELLGLTWDNVNDTTIIISQSINRLGEITQGKNKNANRMIALPQKAKDELDAQRESLKSEGIISPFVFPGVDGKAMTTGHYYKAWLSYSKKTGLPKTTPYGLRHTFVSLNKETPLAMLKPMVGHSERMDTIGVYSHQQDGDAKAVAGYVDSIFQKILK